MVEVAAAILYDQRGRILICRRGAGGNCAGLWEFPGGKREAGESMGECLVRECREELEVEIEVGDLYCDLTWTYPDREIHFQFFKARIMRGEPRMDVHTDMKWAYPSELPEYEFCPADKGLAETLRDRAPGDRN